MLFRILLKKFFDFVNTGWYIVDLVRDLIWDKILIRGKISRCRARSKVQGKILARIHFAREICNFCKVQRLVINVK